MCITRVISRSISSTLAAVAVVLVTVSCSAQGKRADEQISEVSSEISTAHAQLQISGADQVNSDSAQTKPYVILVSIDGYRWDFNQTFSPPELSRLQREGASAESMIPVYPSKTFPNHYSIVTGLYANKHGIVSNEFYDPKRQATYSLPDKGSVSDGSWYGGEPLWVTARKQDMLAASFFWVGSDAKIAGYYPNYYFHYDASVPNEARVDQVLKWLDMPAEKRPHFITLYFSDVDTAGHQSGTKSPAIREAIMKVDSALGRLRQGLAKLQLPVNLIVVSDHGLDDVEPAKVVLLDERPETAALLSKFSALGRGPQLLLYLKKGESRQAVEDLQAALKREAKNYRVLGGRELRRLHYDGNERCGDLVIAPDAGYLVGLKSSAPSTRGANHGWDPTKNKAMHGIFYASGPAFRSRVQVPSFANIHIYPLVTEILGLQSNPGVEGRLSVVRDLLNKSEPKSRDTGK